MGSDEIRPSAKDSRPSKFCFPLLSWPSFACLRCVSAISFEIQVLSPFYHSSEIEPFAFHVDFTSGSVSIIASVWSIFSLLLQGRSPS